MKGLESYKKVSLVHMNTVYGMFIILNNICLKLNNLILNYQRFF